MTHLREIQVAQASIVRRIGAGDVHFLRELFAERVAKWSHPVQHDEVATLGLFDDLHVLPPEVAFRAISIGVELAIADRCPSLECAVALILDLTRASDTTETPQELDQAWATLAERADRFKGARELLSVLEVWYRLD